MIKKNIVFSDLCLLGNDPFRNIEQFQALGNCQVELMMDGYYWDNFTLFKKQFMDRISQYDVAYSLHSPCWDVNLSCEIGRLREANLKVAMDAIDFAAGSKCNYLVIHTGFCQSPAFDRARARERSYEALQMLCRRARESGVRLAVENVGYHGTSLYTYDEFVHLLDEFGQEAGYILDIGHAALNGLDSAALIRDTRQRLLGIHIHDNNGQTDQHLPLGEGVIQWQPILTEMAGLDGFCSLVLEYGWGTPMEKLVETRQYLEKGGSL